MEKQLIPQLRFSEFEREWNSIKIGEIGKPSMCKRIMKDQTLSVGDIPFYKIGTFGKEADAYISNDLYIEYKTKFSFPKKGDILISASGTIGRTVIYDGKPAFFQDSNIVWIANNEEKVLNTLLVYSYENVRWTTENTTIARLYNDNLKNISIAVPNLPEQQKIASFLLDVDDKITKLTKKKTLLEQYKKGIMQKIFNQESRFKDENGNEFSEWEVKRLGSIGSIVSGLTYSPNDINENGVLVLRSSNVKKRLIALNDNVFVNVEEGKFNPVELNDILICVRNGSKRLIGKNAIIKEEHIGLAFGAFMTVYRSKYNRFLFHFFDSQHYKKEVHKNLGATINSINGGDLKKFKVPFPCIAEQTKIANFLSDIDLKIEALNNKIDNSKNFKKGLLQKMFV
ncbi:restriction endonuclease subunit S [Tenacibaculum halocynthiae]|uniref:restriction endonuclease subunit S n=1 Tax=Tenacibaculum halocynthiae TaxID=1254437 RepID=UPI003D658B5E